MKTKKILWAALFALIGLGAQAQEVNKQAEKVQNTPEQKAQAQGSAEEQLKAVQMRAFGAKHTAAAQVGAVADSVAKAEELKSQKAIGDSEPSFPGGEIFLKAYLKKKLLHSGVSGTGDVVVSFRVDKKGNIYGAEVTKSAGGTLDTAAFDIVTGMPRWRPGLANGEPADKPASVTVSFGKDE
jgi:TonB family protein